MNNDWQNYKNESEIIDLLPDSVDIETNAGMETYPLKSNGELIVKHLPVAVPLSYCKRKEYDGAEETFSCMGLGLRIGNAVIKPPSLGVYSLMESTGNPFPKNFSKTTVIQQFHVLYFNEHREEAAELARDWAYAEPPEFDADDETTWTELDKAAIFYVDQLGTQGVDLSSYDVWSKILKLFGTSGNGFEMVPGGGSSSFWFGGETIGGMAVGIGADLNVPLNEILWNTPLAVIGFAYAAKARSNGVKSVQRPHDRADVRRQRILTYLRELNGQLHPWQIAKPLEHNLTDLQAKSPGAVKELERLKNEAQKKKARK